MAKYTIENVDSKKMGSKFYSGMYSVNNFLDDNRLETLLGYFKPSEEVPLTIQYTVNNKNKHVKFFFETKYRVILGKQDYDDEPSNILETLKLRLDDYLAKNNGHK